MMSKEERAKLSGIVLGLMLAENMGDVHDYINLLHELLGLKCPEGDFLHGWTDDDIEALGLGGNDE